MAKVSGSYTASDVKRLTTQEAFQQKIGMYAGGAGLGVELTVFPFLRIFGEYMYDFADHDVYIKSHSANLGLKVDF